MKKLGFTVNLSEVFVIKDKIKISYDMTTISLRNIKDTIHAGYMTLTGAYGKNYRNRALHIPGYGWVPCSRKLQSDFTTNPCELMVVISDEDDSYRPVTSDIWVTRSNIVASF